MRIENIITKKENIEYAPGDVLFVCNEYEEEAYMVFKKDSMYNLIDLNRGKAYLLNNQRTFTKAEIEDLKEEFNTDFNDFRLVEVENRE